MFNLELIMRDLKKSFKRESLKRNFKTTTFIFYLDQDYYYLTNGIYALKIKKQVLENDKVSKGILIGLIGSLDKNVGFRNGKEINLNENVILELLNRINSQNTFENAINSKVLINSQESIFLRVYHNETADRFVYINEDYTNFFKEYDLQLDLNGNYLKQEIENNVLLVMGYKINNEVMPQILKREGGK